MELRILFLILACVSLPATVFSHAIPSEEEDHYHSTLSKSDKRLPELVEGTDTWAKDAQARLKAKVAEEKLEKQAKNIIMLLGDGMSLTTVTAARIYKGQKEGSKYGGEDGTLYMDTFTDTGLSKTYCVDSQVADSACSATAYLSGVKANIATIGVTSDVKLNNCTAQMDPLNQVSSILKWAQDAGKSTGIVTTTRVTHASPAGAYSHIAHRDWEYDRAVPFVGCDDIALQLITKQPGKDINVILGGGRRNFLTEANADPEGGFGYRRDGKNLVQTWLTNKEGMNEKYIYNRTELLAIDPAITDNLLGLFSKSHLAFQNAENREDDPTLSEMTELAVKILSKNPNGFFLFVEGGRIDHAHHDNLAKHALEETLEFDKSINITDSLTNDDDTLIVITSDHSHVMTLNGYPERGNPLLKIAGLDDNKGYPYATLSYANGPGQPPISDEIACTLRDISNDDFEDMDYQQMAMISLSSETHGGDDVMIFAKGPFSHLFSGVYQQNYIPHAMAYAACVGEGETFCSR